MFTNELEPLLLLLNDTTDGHPEPLDPWMRINVSRLADNAKLRLYVTGDEALLNKAAVDTSLRQSRAVLRPFDFNDLRTFSAALSLILLSKDCQDHIMWSKSFRSLIIVDKDLFASTVMPRFFPYQSVDLFAANLIRSGFVASYPPPGHETEPRFAREKRLEFVHTFAQPEISSTARDEVVKAAVAHFKSLIARQAAITATRKLQARERAEANDRPLQAMLRILLDGPKFEELFVNRLGLGKLLPQESPFEDLAVSRQLLLREMPNVIGLFRNALYTHATSPLYLASGEFIATLRDIGAVDDPASAKEAEMAFLEANMASNSIVGTTTTATTDTTRQMVLDEFIGGLFRFAHRKFAHNAWTLAREAEELFIKHVHPAGERARESDSEVLSWLAAVTDRTIVHRVIIEAGPALRDAYYSASAPDAWLSWDKLRAGLSKSRLAVLDQANHVTLIKRAFLLGSAMNDSAPKGSNSTVANPITQDAFRDTLLLMSRFWSLAVSRPGARQPTGHLVPLCTALSAATQFRFDQVEFDEVTTAGAIRAYVESAIDDITTKAPSRKRR